jgi:hypothetical protein
MSYVCSIVAERSMMRRCTHRESHGECHGHGEPDDVQGHLLLVHPVPDVREWHRSVPGEGIPHPTHVLGSFFREKRQQMMIP